MHATYTPTCWIKKKRTEAEQSANEGLTIICVQVIESVAVVRRHFFVGIALGAEIAIIIFGKSHGHVRYVANALRGVNFLNARGDFPGLPGELKQYYEVLCAPGVLWARVFVCDPIYC